MHNEHDTAVLSRPPKKLDYSLTGEESKRAIERGLAEPDWYQTPFREPRCGSCSSAEKAPRCAIRFCGLDSSPAGSGPHGGR